METGLTRYREKSVKSFDFKRGWYREASSLTRDEAFLFLSGY